MNLPLWISTIVMIGITVISIGWGRGENVRPHPITQWFWAILMIQVAILEIVDIVWFDHTLSNEMQWEGQQSWWGQVRIVFWGYIAYHFVLEPIIRRSILPLIK